MFDVLKALGLVSLDVPLDQERGGKHQIFSDVLLKFRRGCSLSSRRPRTVWTGARSSLSPAGNRTWQT